MSVSTAENCLIFESDAFNTTVEREYFINPCCFGDDVARWLIAELRARGYITDDEPGQEDFGWYLTFEVAGTKHHAVIGYRPDSDGADGEWICWIERACGLIGSLLGRRKYVRAEALEAVKGILSSSSSVSALRQCADDDL